MTLKNVSNNAKGTLLSSISAISTTITLGAGQGALFPSALFSVTLKDYLLGVLISQEIVYITSRSSDVLTVNTRAYEACPRTATSLTPVSTAYAFAAYADSATGTTVEVNVTAGMITDISTDLNTLSTTKLSIADYISGARLYAASATGTDAYQITLADVTSMAGVNGQTFRVKVDVANTDAATLQINALGAYSICKLGGTALATGDVKAGQILEVVWNNSSTRFEMLNSYDPSAYAITSGLLDTQYYAGEDVVQNDSVFPELQTTFALATSLLGVCDISSNKRQELLMICNGVAMPTIKLSLKKVGTPASAFKVRLETDSSGTASGTLYDAVNAPEMNIASASVTTSLVDTTFTLSSSITPPAGTKIWVVVYHGTYGSETVDASNYYMIGVGATNSNTRKTKRYDGSSHFANGFPISLPGTRTLDGSVSTSLGWYITTGAGTTLITGVNVIAGDTATRCRIWSAADALLATSTLRTGDKFIFNLTVTASTNYKIECDNSGGAYTAYYITPTAAAYPIPLNGYTAIGRSNGLVTDTTMGPRNIDSLDTNGTAGNNFPYIGGAAASSYLLAKTDANFSYKLPTDMLRFVNANKSAGAQPTCINTGEVTTFSGLTVGDYFLSGTPGGIMTAAAMTAASPALNKCFVGKCPVATALFLMYRLMLVTTQAVGASAYTYQNTLGFQIGVSITAGTVSLVQVSRDGVTYYTVAAATNCMVWLNPLDYVKITHSSTPTMTIFYY